MRAVIDLRRLFPRAAHDLFDADAKELVFRPRDAFVCFRIGISGRTVRAMVGQQEAGKARCHQ